MHKLATFEFEQPIRAFSFGLFEPIVGLVIGLAAVGLMTLFFYGSYEMIGS